MRRRPRRRRKFTEAEVEVYVQSVLPRVIEEAVGAPNEKLDDGKRMHEELKSRRQQLVDERVKAEPSEEDGSETSEDEICGICGLCFEEEHSDNDEAGSEGGLTNQPPASQRRSDPRANATVAAGLGRMSCASLRAHTSTRAVDSCLGPGGS
mmetsp:Transcript_96869/g.294081  ORF Transcript_96869/g.294081 Transcript_96869/m.294081 type:complete len:152 (-) Transcript_96869:113-568(-)